MTGLNGNSTEKADNRLHIPIKDADLQRRIKKVMKEENLTYEELCQKYFKLPEDEFEVIQNNFNRVKKTIYSKTYDQNLSLFLDLVWVVIMRTVKKEFDIKEFQAMVTRDFDKYVLKKR